MNSKTAWTTERVPGHPRQYNNTYAIINNDNDDDDEPKNKKDILILKN